MRAIYRGLLAAAALSLPSAVFAQPITIYARPTGVDAPRAMAVRYDDLNLASQAGAMHLVDRIEYAAVQVCGPVDLDHVSQARDEYVHCYTHAVQAAVADVNAPLVTAMFSGRPILLASNSR